MKVRPPIYFLENVPEIRQGYEVAGVETSDADFTIMNFKAHMMFCFSVTFDSQTKGSAKAHDRMLCVVGGW